MMADDLTLQFETGDVFANRYKIIRKLATGKMGIVYACRHIDFDNRVEAVKILYPCVASDELSIARLHREIISSYLVTNTNVVRTYEYIHHNELFGYSMEYIDGENLKTILKHNHKLEPRLVADLLRQICNGVSAIHAVDMIHRNLKPSNIIVDIEGTAKITDFGIVKPLNSTPLTETGGIVGSLSYMSPEYMTTGKLDKRTDIYAIGVIGYEMLTGKLPEIKSKSVIDYIKKRTDAKSSLEKQDIPNCPAKLDAIIKKALAVNPDERYQTAKEMQFDLTNFLNLEFNTNMHSPAIWSSKRNIVFAHPEESYA